MTGPREGARECRPNFLLRGHTRGSVSVNEQRRSSYCFHPASVFICQARRGRPTCVISSAWGGADGGLFVHLNAMTASAAVRSPASCCARPREQLWLRCTRVQIDDLAPLGGFQLAWLAAQSGKAAFVPQEANVTASIQRTWRVVGVLLVHHRKQEPVFFHPDKSSSRHLPHTGLRLCVHWRDRRAHLESIHAVSIYQRCDCALLYLSVDFCVAVYRMHRARHYRDLRY